MGTSIPLAGREDSTEMKTLKGFSGHQLGNKVSLALLPGPGSTSAEPHSAGLPARVVKGEGVMHPEVLAQHTPSSLLSQMTSWEGGEKVRPPPLGSPLSALSLPLLPPPPQFPPGLMAEECWRAAAGVAAAGRRWKSSSEPGLVSAAVPHPHCVPDGADGLARTPGPP